MKNLIALGNDTCRALGIVPHSNPGALEPGQVCLANDSLFSQATFSQEVTTYGIGYTDPNRNKLMELLGFIAPTRNGPRNATITVYDEDEPFASVDPAKVKRELLADFPEVKQRTSSKVTRKLANRGLTLVLDNDQLKDKPNWQTMHAAWLMDLLARASIIECVALFRAMSPSSPVVWDALANPDMDVKSTNQQVLATATGFKANRALIGEDVTLLRQLAYEARNDPGGVAGALAQTDEQLATRMGLDRVRSNAERYNNGGSKDTFLGNSLFLFTAQDQESPEDSSNIVRHVSNADFGGGNYATYIEQRLKKTFLTVENYELLAVQHTSGACELSVTGV